MSHHAALDQIFAAAEAGDWATFRSMFADDALLKQNVGPQQSIDEAMKTLPLFTADGTNPSLRERPSGIWARQRYGDT